MDPVPLVVVLAVSWYAGMFWVERSRKPGSTTPSLNKLLRSVELDLLRTLRSELTRLSQTKPKPRYGRKLKEVNNWLEKIGAYHAG